MSKLYTTATSEKASKGQGGNKWLYVDIKDEEEKSLLYIQLDIAQNGDILGSISGQVNETFRIKGKKQKDEEWQKPLNTFLDKKGYK